MCSARIALKPYIYADYEDQDQPVHLHSLIQAFITSLYNQWLL